MAEIREPCVDHFGGVGQGAPRKAKIGFLCWACWAKFQDALEDVEYLIRWLRAAGPVRFWDQDGHAAYGPRIPIPGTALAADELQQLWDDLGTAEPEVLVESPDGAAAAVRLTRALQRADRTWPREEHAHRVRWLRCRNCGQRTLEWRPPLEWMDDIQIVCDRCGYHEPYELLAHDAAVLEAEARKRKRKRAS
jgi:DNA-directed RNA polymerase subunit RPC12/RpoP